MEVVRQDRQRIRVAARDDCNVLPYFAEVRAAAKVNTFTASHLHEPHGDVFPEHSAQLERWAFCPRYSFSIAANRSLRWRVTGYNPLAAGSGQNPAFVLMNTGSSGVFAFAPAIEYNLRSNLGVILGPRVIPASHNASATVTPVVAINFVH
jgi:hypothetical protein